MVFLIELFLFFTTVDLIAVKQARQEPQKRSWGLPLGWLTTITIGLMLGKTRQQEEAVPLAKSLIIVRESLQAIMLLLSGGVLCYVSYFV